MFFQLKVYATKQSRLQDWDGTNIGYTYDISDNSDVLLPITVLIAMPIAAVVLFVLVDKMRGVIESSPSVRFLYGLEIPASIITFFEFVTFCILLANCQLFSCFVKALTTIVLFFLGVCIVLHLITDEYIRILKSKNCCKNCLSILSMFYYVYIKFLSNLVFFKILIALALISFIPLILLIVVYPAEILCTILIYFASLIMSTLLLTIPAEIISYCTKGKIKDGVKDFNKDRDGKGYLTHLRNWITCNRGQQRDPEASTPEQLTERPQATEQQATEQQATEQQATEQQATEQQATEQQATEQQATEQQAREQQAVKQ